jgi:tetratricopeptide (TPR) repeat protein
MYQSKSFRLSLVLCLFVVKSFASTADSLYQQGNAWYAKQNYQQAIEKYESILAQNTPSFEVFYNLGNAYYKTGNFTKAILNYERARKIKPFDDDLAMNLALANQNTIDKIEPAPQVFYEIWWNNYLTGNSLDQRAFTLLLCIWLAFIAACFYLFSQNSTFKKWSFFSVFVLSILAFFFLFVANQQQEKLKASNEAIIINPSSFVKSSPDAKGTNLFQLHAGTKTNVLDELNGWKKIRIPNGNEGWIRSEDLEKI